MSVKLLCLKNESQSSKGETLGTDKFCDGPVGWKII
jgi:hypothetical protein